MINRLFNLIFILLFIVSFSLNGNARAWRTTPQALAQEYAQILDQRSPSEIVMVIWVTPQLVPERFPNTRTQKVLSDNMLVGIGHIDIIAGGKLTYRRPANISVDIQNEETQFPLSLDQIDAGASDILDTFLQIFEKSLGPMGRSIKWMVFNGKLVKSCEKGGFSINYAGEKYTYKTPIPGC
tara:strand:- start:4963 stop:5508 length:546 start_codon:yes stop_codon:yes gene_type:complete